MTDMTQAPTPGPLSGDDVNRACKACGAFKAERDAACTFCGLAPTAPVEASGSEREADAWKWLGQLYPNDAPSDLAYDANEMVDAFLAGSGRSDRMAKALERIADEQQYRSGYCQTDITVEPALTAEEAQTVAREALAQQTAPRPQPSGETRAALDRLKMAAHVYEDDEMAADCATLEALLSARPLALGGQQGETVTIIRDRLRRIWEGDTHLVYSGNPPEPSHDEEGDLAKLANEAVEALNTLFPVPDALSTTPARSEAQDEGAAGKWPEVTDQWAETYCDLTGQNPDGAQVSFIGDGAVTTTFRDKAKRQIEAMLCAAPKAAVRAISAHPSPTPAADADRVRIAVEALEPFKLAANIMDGDEPDSLFIYDSPESTMISYGDLRRAASVHDALKSTAAKEGGAL